MPHDTNSSDKPQLPSSRRRWIIAPLGIITFATIFYGLTHLSEPGEDWFVPMDAPKSQDWAQAILPAEPWTSPTNETLGIDCKIQPGTKGERDIRIINQNIDQFSFWKRGRTPSDFADFIQADADNKAVLPDGTVLQLGKIIAYPDEKEKSLCFEIKNGTAVRVEKSNPIQLDRAYPSLELILDQSPANTVIVRDYNTFEQSTGRRFLYGGENLREFRLPLLLQGAANILVRCYFGGMQTMEIAATPGSFAENNSGVIRYCGEMTQGTNPISYSIYSKDATSLLHGDGFYPPPEYKTSRLFIFTHALGASEVMSVEATLENGEKIPLSVVDRRNYSECCLLRGPATTDSPIRSFTLTLPSRSARVAFTIPPLPGITSGQNVKNRFDLRFSASEAALFKGNKSFAWIQNLEDIIGLRTWEMNRMAAMPCHTFDGVDLTGKTVREAFVIYLQKYGQNPDDYVTDVTFGDFERKKRPGIRIWRWLCKNGGLQWLRDHGYQEWLEKAGIEEG